MLSYLLPPPWKIFGQCTLLSCPPYDTKTDSIMHLIIIIVNNIVSDYWHFVLPTRYSEFRIARDNFVSYSTGDPKTKTKSCQNKTIGTLELGWAQELSRTGWGMTSRAGLLLGFRRILTSLGVVVLLINSLLLK